MGTSRTRHAERGSAILITLLLVVGLIGGGAVMISMQLKSTRGAEIVRTGITARYCAEAGVVAARALVSANYASWPAALQAGLVGAEPTFLQAPAVNHDLDGDGVADFIVTIKDNDDESGALDPSRDNDLAVWLISTCTKYPEQRPRVSELIRVSVPGTCYEGQLGGCGGNGNGN